MKQQQLYQPYTYCISWTHLDVHYYGVRYAKEIIGLKPEEDFWIRYFTSSEYVEKFREKHGEPDRIKICQRFDNAEDAKLWEEKFLRRMDVIHEERWLNKSFSDGNFCNPGHDETARLKISKASKEHWQRDEYCILQKEAMKKRWQDNDQLTKRAEISKELWQNPEFRSKTIAAQKEGWKDEEKRAKQSEILKAYSQTSEAKEKRSKVTKELWQNKEYRENYSKAINRPEVKAKMSEKAIKRCQNPEYRAKQLKARKGRFWITDGINSKLIFETEIIPEGWYRGRPKLK